MSDTNYVHRVVESRGWDYFLPVGIGGLLWFLKPQLSEWWNRSYNPTPTCLHVVDLAGSALRGLLTWEGLGLMSIVVFFAYLTISGRGRILRAIKIAAFFAAAIDVALGVHIPLGSVPGWSEGFEHAFDQVFWVGGTVCLGVPVIILLILSILMWMAGLGKDAWNRNLMTLGILSWFELLMAANAMKWKDLVWIALIGYAASAAEWILATKDLKPDPVAMLVHRFWVNLVRLVIAYVYIATGAICYAAFLAAWAPNLGC